MAFFMDSWTCAHHNFEDTANRLDEATPNRLYLSLDSLQVKMTNTDTNIRANTHELEIEMNRLWTLIIYGIITIRSNLVHDNVSLKTQTVISYFKIQKLSHF